MAAAAYGTNSFLYFPGYYVYAETSGYYQGHFGELLGPNLMPSQTCQIRFCYHMYGSNMGTLNVYTRNTNDAKPDQTQKKIFSETGDHGDKWFCKFLKIPNTVQYSIVFESVRGNGFRSDIALDDIKFISCGNLGPTAAPTPTPKPSIQNEDFEDCISCWKNDKTGHDQMDWSIGRGSTGSLNTGPSFDHTKKTVYGRYLYIEASNQSAWDHADLESRLLVVQKRCFMSFYYHMYGKTVGWLMVTAYIYDNYPDLTSKQLS